MRDPAPWQKRYGRMLLLSLLFGLVGQYLFVGKLAGISVLLFAAGFYGIYVYAVQGRFGGFDKWHGQSLAAWALLPVIGLLALTYALYDNRLFHALNAVVLPILVFGQTMIMTRVSKNPWYRLPFLQELLRHSIAKPLLHLPAPFRMLRELLPIGNRRSPGGGKLSQAALGLLLAAPILFVVIALLASADSIFQSWVSVIPHWFDGISVGDGVVRTIATGFITLYTFCYIWGLLFPQTKESAESAAEWEMAAISSGDRSGGSLKVHPVTAATLLLSVNAVYVLFAAIQFSYLFGAADGLLPAGVAYAEYARRGFAELVLVALINMGLLLGGLRLIQAGGAWAEKLRKLLLSLLVGCTIVMLASAYSRLSLYENAYGYTQTRLLVHGFMLYLAVVLAIALYRIWQERFYLAKATVCVSIAAYLIMNYVNLDARIAANNIERFEQTGVIDLPYLKELSADAWPALQGLQISHPEMLSLQPALDKMQTPSVYGGTWPSWNLSRHRAQHADR